MRPDAVSAARMVPKNQLYQGSSPCGIRNQPYMSPQMTPKMYPERT